MADVIIIVDDKKQNTATLAYRIGEQIVKETQGHDTIITELIDGVIISDAIDTIAEAITRITSDGENNILGIVVDLFETGDPSSGAKLLEKLKNDPRTYTLPTVIFTSKLIEISYEHLISLGAKEVIQRDLVCGEAPHIQIAKRILLAFGIKT